MHRLTNDRNIDLSKNIENGDHMISAKFLSVCGVLMAIMVSFISTPLVIGAIAVTAFNFAAKPNNKTYVISVLLLLFIAMRTAWIMQGAS